MKYDELRVQCPLCAANILQHQIDEETSTAILHCSINRKSTNITCRNCDSTVSVSCRLVQEVKVTNSWRNSRKGEV
jgi:hypothetical protein